MNRRTIVIVMLGSFLTSILTCIIVTIFQIVSYQAIGIIVIIVMLLVIIFLERWISGG
jgi:hypothetical protein